MQRWIIHIDMDAFFAAVEQRDNPDLQGNPVIVGGLGKRGVVSTASYEARRVGVHSAMPMTEARRLCPKGIFLAGNHHKYAKVSGQIAEILAAFSPVIEPLSLDEAFLDVTGMEWLYLSPVEIAKQIKQRIKAELGLVASAGIAPNKLLAKMASDLSKPDGLLFIEPGKEAAFLKGIPVERMWGVGATTAKQLKAAGLQYIGQLAKADNVVLARYFGNNAAAIRQLAMGLDDRPVVPEHAPKSIGNEITFEKDIHTKEAIKRELLALSQKVGRRLRQDGYAGRTVTVKVRFASFKTITRSKTLTEPTFLDEVIYEIASAIMENQSLAEGVRLLGVTLSNLQPQYGQPSLFSDDEDKRVQMSEAVDRLKDRFGEGIVTRGRLL